MPEEAFATSVVTFCSIVVRPSPITAMLKWLLELSCVKVIANPKVAFTVMARAYTTNDALYQSTVDQVRPHKTNLMVGWLGKELNLLKF